MVRVSATGMELYEAVDSLRTVMTFIEEHIPDRDRRDFDEAYRLLTGIADRAYMDATGDRTIEEIHGGE